VTPLAPGEIKRLGLKEKNYFLFMARLVPEKGAHLLIQAWQQIPSEYRSGRKLVIAGDSNHKDKYYFDLMGYKKATDIIFTGFATGRLKAELLSNALCFVQPSTIEGMPLSILEAIGYKRMILASDIQENKDVLSGLGWLFKSGNIKDLSGKLIQIMGLNEDIVTEAARALNNYGTRTYNWDIITDTIEQYLMKLFK
jgi:glycosyltransferase involved in cell wall biosynthesis